jgi:hypothetical protein
MKKIEFVWENVGKKMIKILCPLRLGMFSIQRKKLGQLGSEIVFINSNAELIKTYIFH